MEKVYLKEMAEEDFYRFFRGYKNDADLYFYKSEFKEYVYDEAAVKRYIERQKALNRSVIGIFSGEDIIGEVKFSDIKEGESATFQITLKNDDYKNRGIGTAAEKLVVAYAFEKLKLKTLYADALVTNARSRRVLEKVGFTPFKEDDEFVYYRIEARR